MLKGADLRSPTLLWELHRGCSSAGRVRDAQKPLITKASFALCDRQFQGALSTWQHSCGGWESPNERAKFAISLSATLTPLAHGRSSFSAGKCVQTIFCFPWLRIQPQGVWWQDCDRWLYYLWLRKTAVISWRSFRTSTKETSKYPANMCECLGHVAFQVSWGFFCGSWFLFVLKTEISWVLWEIWAKLDLSA